jgi:TonB family protein
MAFGTPRISIFVTMKNFFFFSLFSLLVFSCTPDGRFDEQYAGDTMAVDSAGVDTFSVKRPQALTETEKKQLEQDKKSNDSVEKVASDILHQGDPDHTTVVSDAGGVVLDPDIGPSFPGGEDAMETYIAKKKIYPLIAFQNDVKGVVQLKVVVESDGKIGGIKIVQGIGYGCDEAAVDVVRGMPHWIPGKKGDANVRCAITLPISFGY